MPVQSTFVCLFPVNTLACLSVLTPDLSKHLLVCRFPRGETPSRSVCRSSVCYLLCYKDLSDLASMWPATVIQIKYYLYDYVIPFVSDPFVALFLEIYCRHGENKNVKTVLYIHFNHTQFLGCHGLILNTTINISLNLLIWIHVAIYSTLICPHTVSVKALTYHVSYLTLSVFISFKRFTSGSHQQFSFSKLS